MDLASPAASQAAVYANGLILNFDKYIFSDPLLKVQLVSSLIGKNTLFLFLTLFI